MPQDPPLRRSSHNEHPCLTEKGLRLQRQGRNEAPIPMTLPVYPSGKEAEIGNPSDQVVDPFAMEDDKRAPIHKILPEARVARAETAMFDALNENAIFHDFDAGHA